MNPTKNSSVLAVSKGQRCGERERLVTEGGLRGDGHTHSFSIFPGAHLDTEGRQGECHRAPYGGISAVVSRGVSRGPLRPKSPPLSSQLPHPRSHLFKATQSPSMPGTSSLCLELKCLGSGAASSGSRARVGGTRGAGFLLLWRPVRETVRECRNSVKLARGHLVL